MEHEVLIRVGFFVTLSVIFASLEALLPRRPRVQTRRVRWFTNWAVPGLDAAALRGLAGLMPLLAVGAALNASRMGNAMHTGLHWQDDRPARLGWTLILPFRKS